MRTRDLFYLVFSNLLRMKTRVLMTASGVVIGTTAVNLLIALGLGLQVSFRENVGKMGDLTLLKVDPNVLFDESIEGRPQLITITPLNPDALERIAALEGVEGVVPYMIIGGTKLRWQNWESNPNLTGADPEQMGQLGLPLASGEFETGAGKAVLGAAVGEFAYDSRRSRAGEIPVGELQDQMIEVVLTRYLYDQAANMYEVPTEERTLRLQVAGVLERSGGWTDHAIYISLGEAEALNAWMEGQQANRIQAGYPYALVKTEDTLRAVEVEEQILDMGFRVDSPRKFITEMNQFFLMIQVMLAGVGGVALLVSSFGIANTMIMAIYERTREIGLLKSLGATNADVMWIFLAEAGSIGFLGGSGGIGIAVLLSRSIHAVGGDLLAQAGTRMMNMQGGSGLSSEHILMLPLWLLVSALCFAVLVGALSGVYPAFRAASLDPLEALRYE
jgi:putative ABC transport system permease protein